MACERPEGAGSGGGDACPRESVRGVRLCDRGHPGRVAPPEFLRTSVPANVRAFFSRLFGGRPETGLPAYEDGPHDRAGHDTATQDGVARELATARQAFLDACNSYDASGVRLEQEVITQLAPYHDHAYDRATIIRSFARDLSQQIQSFSRTRQRELSQVAMLTLNFMVTTGTLRTAVLSGALTSAWSLAMPTGLGGDPAHPPARGLVILAVWPAAVLGLVLIGWPAAKRLLKGGLSPITADGERRLLLSRVLGTLGLGAAVHRFRCPRRRRRPQPIASGVG